MWARYCKWKGLAPAAESIVARVMREQSIAADRRREREQSQAQMETIVMRGDETSKLIERLDLAYDELRRKVHHATTRATTRAATRPDNEEE